MFLIIKDFLSGASLGNTEITQLTFNLPSVKIPCIREDRNQFHLRETELVATEVVIKLFVKEEKKEKKSSALLSNASGLVVVKAW